MDALDSILIDAWNRVSAKVRRDRVQALKRSRRRFKGVLTRPMREWCLVIRASDTRINGFTAILDPPEVPYRLRGDRRLDPVQAHFEHTVTLSGELIRRLTKPVSIAWPGVTYEQAAKVCGREYKTIKNWIRRGVFKVEHYREFTFPEFNRRSKGGTSNGGRGGRPYVWTPSPIDPNNFEGRAPHRVWGTLWQSLWENLPENYELVVRREPRFRTMPNRSDAYFRGWYFICPGRLDANGQYKGCGRRCQYLYAPQTVWTLGKALGIESGFEMPEDSGLVGEWLPGASDPIRAAAPEGRSFACKTCWSVRSACMANDQGWNDFIAHISGGLLYGRNVKRSKDICPIERKKPEYRRRTRKEMAAARARDELMVRSKAGEAAAG